MEHHGHRFAQPSDFALLRSELSAEDWNRLSILLEQSCSRPDWILLSCDGGRLAEALVLIAPRELQSPVDVIRLHGRFSSREVSLRLFQRAIGKAQTLGAQDLYCTALEDSHDASLLSDLGFQKWRRIVRFERGNAVPDALDGVDFVAAGDFERPEIVQLIAQTSAHSSDLQIQHYRRRLGEMADAVMTLQVMESTKYDPNWWRVAIDSDRRAIGVIFPVIAFGEPTVGFVGVIGDYRRRGIASALLAESWSVMNREGHSNLSAETDARNIPMHRALTKSGFARRWEKQEWRLGLNSSRELF